MFPCLLACLLAWLSLVDPGCLLRFQLVKQVINQRSNHFITQWILVKQQLDCTGWMERYVWYRYKMDRSARREIPYLYLSNKQTINQSSVDQTINQSINQSISEMTDWVIQAKRKVNENNCTIHTHTRTSWSPRMANGGSFFGCCWVGFVGGPIITMYFYEYCYYR